MSAIKEPGDAPLTVRFSGRRDATLNLPDLLSWGRSQLERVGLPGIEAEWLLKWVLDENSLILAPRQVGLRAAESYRSAVSQRRARVPLQHITGQMDFRGLTLHAGPGVFSTRPETEMLVEYALKNLGPVSYARIADLCAGSGAIGLSLACEMPGSHVWLVERSQEAMEYLLRNVKDVAVGESTVSPVLGDALYALPELDGTLDLVAANPPYVGLADSPTQPEAQVDPQMALYGGGEDGMVIPRGIVVRAGDLLKPGGVLVMEHGERQGRDLCDHALSVGFDSAETLDDLTGRSRFMVAVKGEK